MQRNVAFSGFARVVEEEPKVNTGALNFSASSSNPRKGQQNDSDNALLAQLLTDDLNNLQSLYLAESIQLELALKDSRGDNQLAVEVEKIELVLSPEQQSRIASLKAEIDYVQSQASKRVAEKLEKMREILESDNRLAAALQDALGAETRKETLDREFALVLGRVDAQGREDIDIVARGGVERVLGREKVGLIMRAPLHRPEAPKAEKGSGNKTSKAPEKKSKNPQTLKNGGHIHPTRASNIPPSAAANPLEREPRAPQTAKKTNLFHRHHDATLEAARQVQQTKLDQAVTAKNKGKGKASSNPFPSAPAAKSPETKLSIHLLSPVYSPFQPSKAVPVVRPSAKCNICFDDFYLSSNPFASALANTLAGPYGLIIGKKEDKHQYCLGCLRTYIEAKLSGDGKTFPIKCPESQQCSVELTSADAALVFGSSNLEAWHYKQLLDSTPPLHCPNKRCSARVIRHQDETQPQAQCPACKQLMCVDCGSKWHIGLTCAQFQALPAGERDVEDRALLNLAQKEKWARCPDCKVVVELTDGCFHITCSCGGEFCYLCNFKWDPIGKRCTNPKTPACELWEEDRLLRAQERERNPVQYQAQVQLQAQQQAQQQAQLQAQQQARQDQIQQQQRQAEEIARLVAQQQLTTDRATREAKILADDATRAIQPGRQFRSYSRLHPFTTKMFESFICGYCDIRFQNVAGLVNHLSRTRHSVYACCSKFFKEPAHINQHLTMANPTQHTDTCRG